MNKDVYTMTDTATIIANNKPAYTLKYQCFQTLFRGFAVIISWLLLYSCIVIFNLTTQCLKKIVPTHLLLLVCQI